MEVSESMLSCLPRKSVGDIASLLIVLVEFAVIVHISCAIDVWHYAYLRVQNSYKFFKLIN